MVIQLSILKTSANKILRQLPCFFVAVKEKSFKTKVLSTYNSSRNYIKIEKDLKQQKTALFFCISCNCKFV